MKAKEIASHKDFLAQQANKIAQIGYSFEDLTIDLKYDDADQSESLEAMGKVEKQFEELQRSIRELNTTLHHQLIHGSKPKNS